MEKIKPKLTNYPIGEDAYGVRAVSLIGNERNEGCHYHCRFCVLSGNTSKSNIMTDKNKQISYEELPIDVQRQLQDHVNALLSIKNAQIPGGIERLRKGYSHIDLPLRRFRFYGDTSEQNGTDPAVIGYIGRLNQIVDSANFALIEEIPADLGKLRSLEIELMRACYGEREWDKIQARAQAKEEMKGGKK